MRLSRGFRKLHAYYGAQGTKYHTRSSKRGMQKPFVFEREPRGPKMLPGKNFETQPTPNKHLQCSCLKKKHRRFGTVYA